MLTHPNLRQFVANAQRHKISVFRFGMLAQHREFITAITASNIVAAQALTNAQSNQFQDFIANDMAVFIVDAFEMVNINDQQACLFITGVLQAQCSAGLLPPVIAAVNRGQRVYAAQ